MTIISKIFREPLYGYVSIPSVYCKSFIDTQIFQRLRRIEQTSMRVLYPSAHHDRFAHSIGVFHLGRLAFQSLWRNSKEIIILSDSTWEMYQKTFEIACLLHDCGHSPFSHTFEDFYFFGRDEELRKRLVSHFSDKDPAFEIDFASSSPASHEKISAIVLLETYKDEVIKNGGNPLLAVRMILGCVYLDPQTLEQRVENRLILLLNGSITDVDSLDYTQRDTWASGVSNVSIDYQRFLSSLMIRNDEVGIPEIVLKKQAISVLENIVLGRNYLFKWVYSHHKVTYDQFLLVESIKQINKNTGDRIM